jgi:hypothetical protein
MNQRLRGPAQRPSLARMHATPAAPRMRGAHRYDDGLCAVGLTALGVGSVIDVDRQLVGIVYRTFSDPLTNANRAALTTPKKMEVTVDGLDKTKQGESVRARATNRVIEIEFEFHCFPDARANMRVS